MTGWCLVKHGVKLAVTPAIQTSICGMGCLRDQEDAQLLVVTNVACAYGLGYKCYTHVSVIGIIFTPCVSL